jgi:hypothetical protein
MSHQIVYRRLPIGMSRRASRLEMRTRSSLVSAHKTQITLGLMTSEVIVWSPWHRACFIVWRRRKERRQVDNSRRRQEKPREVAIKKGRPLRDDGDYNRNCFDSCDTEEFNVFLRSARCRKARGYFGAADSLRDFEIFRGASVLFPINRSQVERGK